MDKYLVARHTNSWKSRVAQVYTTPKNTPLLARGWGATKETFVKRENSVPGQYINTGDLPTHSVIRELYFDFSSDNIDNCVNRRHVSRSAPCSRSEPSVRSRYVDEMCTFFWFFFFFFFAFIVLFSKFLVPIIVVTSLLSSESLCNSSHSHDSQ